MCSACQVADLQKQNEILGAPAAQHPQSSPWTHGFADFHIVLMLKGMENEMLADYLQRDAERTSGLEDTDEVGRPVNQSMAPRIPDRNNKT